MENYLGHNAHCRMQIIDIINYLSQPVASAGKRDSGVLKILFRG